MQDETSPLLNSFKLGQDKEKCKNLLCFCTTLFAFILLVLKTSALTSLFAEQHTTDSISSVLPYHKNLHTNRRQLSVAILSNSQAYFNDLPRLLETLSEGRIRQDSCLHGAASLVSMLIEGNGMYPQFATTNSIIDDKQGHVIFDYGACTVRQLLLGADPTLETPEFTDFVDSDPHDQNACRIDSIYRHYKEENAEIPAHWDHVVFNDYSRNPSHCKTRQEALEVLETRFIPWFQQIGSKPVFFFTQAYSIPATDSNNMVGIEDVANFTSLTAAGYQEYMKLLSRHLPESQAPILAPCGLAWLTVYEERPELWWRLFHFDHIHPSPSGTLLHAMVLHYALLGRMPRRENVLRNDISELWSNSRMMQHSWDPPNPMPDYETAEYLYNVAYRVSKGHIPASFISYQNGEVAFEG